MTGVSGRKKQVLKELQDQANPVLMGLLQQRWEQLLGEVQRVRSQAYGWLKTGSLVLMTEDVAVLAFAFQPQRNAVMKPAERAAIEQGLSTVMGRPLQVLALLRTDWEQFCAETDGTEKSLTGNPGNEENTNTDDLASRAIHLFGREVVEVRED
jgi:DNA polymerase-3 subunit gamma/tau